MILKLIIQFKIYSQPIEYFDQNFLKLFYLNNFSIILYVASLYKFK